MPGLGSPTPSARARRDQVIASRLIDSHRLPPGICGSLRLLDDLAEEGIRIGCRHVARLIEEQGLQGVRRRRGVRTTAATATHRRLRMR